MSSPSFPPPADDPTADPLSKFTDVRPRPAEWLWRNWLPLGKLAILDSDPGLGNRLSFSISRHASATTA